MAGPSPAFSALASAIAVRKDGQNAAVAQACDDRLRPVDHSDGQRPDRHRCRAEPARPTIVGERRSRGRPACHLHANQMRGAPVGHTPPSGRAATSNAARATLQCEQQAMARSGKKQRVAPGGAALSGSKFKHGEKWPREKSRRIPWLFTKTFVSKKHIHGPKVTSFTNFILPNEEYEEKAERVVLNLSQPPSGRGAKVMVLILSVSANGVLVLKSGSSPLDGCCRRVGGAGARQRCVRFAPHASDSWGWHSPAR